MSDSAKAQESGGGEGSASQIQPVQPAPENVKPSVGENEQKEVVSEQKEVQIEQNEVQSVQNETQTGKNEQTEAKAEQKENQPDQKEARPESIAPQPELKEVHSDQGKLETAIEKPVELTQAETVAAPVLEENTSIPKPTEDWQYRELQLLKKIEELETVKNERTEDGFKLELKVREEEIDLLKARVRNLETELQAALSKPSGKNHEMIENIKQQHEELLSKARGMIFDKTKMVKNQELQIEALTTQVQSLKDINLITKDLLEIRNGEIKAMEDRLAAMEARFKGEKTRYELVLQRAQTSSNINDDLRKEYETQLAIFKELREKYEQRVQALVAENNRLKESVKGASSSK